MLSSSAVDREGERAKTGWLGIRIMCPYIHVYAHTITQKCFIVKA